jgi:hypothetical protein
MTSTRKRMPHVGDRALARPVQHQDLLQLRSYRGLKGLRTVIFLNASDVSDRGVSKFDLIDFTSFFRDSSTWTMYGYRGVQYEIPSGCSVGYMPELNVLCGIADFKTQSERPLTQHLIVEVNPSTSNGSQP